jgi:hypothetical protein
MSTTEEYPFAKMDKRAFDQLQEILATLRASSGQTLPLRSFEALMAKTRVQLYIDQFTMASQTFSSVALNEPVTLTVAGVQVPQMREDIAHVQHMLNVLFYFERNRPGTVRLAKDDPVPDEGTPEAFYWDVRRWILSLGALLLRRASYDDHLFLLQHLLCCPGIASWGSCLLQFPTTWTSLTAEHFVRTIYVFTRPISRALRQSGDDTAATQELEDWQVVAGPDLVQRRKFQILEDDFMALFEQLPFNAFCNFLLAHRGAYEMGPKSSMLLSDLLNVLCGSLRRLTHYRSLAKLVTRMATTLLLFSATRTQQQQQQAGGAAATSLYSLGFNVS